MVVVVVVVVPLLLAALFAINRAHKWLILLICRLAHLLVCVCVCQSVYWSVWKVYYGKMAEWMLFGMVSGVG